MKSYVHYISYLMRSTQIKLLTGIRHLLDIRIHASELFNILYYCYVIKNSNYNLRRSARITFKINLKLLFPFTYYIIINQSYIKGFFFILKEILYKKITMQFEKISHFSGKLRSLK